MMKKIIFSLASIFLFTIALAIIFEITCRVYDAVNKSDSVDSFIYVPYLNYRLKPFLKDREDFATKFNTNSFGFRGKEFSRKKAKNVYRIIAIGDSCTFGIVKGGDDNTYPALLEKKLNQEIPKKRFEVINAGFLGYSSLQNLISFVVELADYEPDMIIVYSGWNDLTRVFDIHTNLDVGYESIFVGENKFRYKNEKVSSLHEAIGRVYLKLNKLAFVRRIRRLRYKILKWLNKEELFKGEKDQLSNIFLSIAKESSQFYASESFYTNRVLGIYERCLDSLLSSAKNKGVKVVVLTLPQLLPPDMPKQYYEKVVDKFPALYYFAMDEKISNLWNSLYHQFDNVIRAVADKNDCFLIDTASYLPRDNSNIDFFYDFVHLNDKGNNFLAEILYREISKILK